MVFSSPIMIIASVAFVTRALSSTNLLACQPRGSCLLHLLQQYRLVWEAAAYLHIFYHFFFIIIVFLFLKMSSLRRGTFVYLQFSGAASWSLQPLKRLVFLESSDRGSLQTFLIPTVNLLIIPGPLFCLDCLSPMMASIISSWSWRFPSYETLFSTVVLFLLCSCDDDTWL